MSEFQELIKNFERIRDYMRQFFVYGFKVRGDYKGKSARTYDNERRRIESFLTGYTRSEYTAKGKKIYINVDSKTIPENPLYAAWKSKSFTDKDIMLHFFLPDLLKDNLRGLTSSEAAEQISLIYQTAFDSQTVRLKLREYERLGIFTSVKKGRELRYFFRPPLPMEDASRVKLWNHLMQAVSFYQGASPFGIVGSTLLDREEKQNRFFQYKHQFLVHTLEDQVLMDILSAIHQKKAVSFKNNSHRSGLTVTLQGVPLKIFVSTRTGRRYLCLYLTSRQRFQNVRLDSLSEIKLLEPFSGYEKLQEKLEKHLPHCFGVSFGGRRRMEEIHMELYINEEKEGYVLDRLSRERRGGSIQRIARNRYLYSGYFYDTNEMLSWIKTFTGRVLHIRGNIPASVQKVTTDWERMYQMYCTGDDPDEH